MPRPVLWIRSLIWPAAGLGLGLLLAAFTYKASFQELLRAEPWLGRAFDFMHLPAWCLLGMWSWLELPPSGDDRFALIPIVVVVQWVVIGFLVGILVKGRS